MKEELVIANLCPECPPREDVDDRYATLALCATHRPTEGGSEDILVSFDKDFNSSIESSDETNRAWSRFLQEARRRKRRSRARPIVRPT